MQVTFNESGTHIHKGLLKVRLDITPESADKTYQVQHIWYPDETSREFLVGYKGKLNPDGTPQNQADYNAWWSGLPHIWKDNPALCHFITIDEMTTLDELKTYFDQTINPDVLATADDILWRYYGSHESAHRISPLMRNRGRFSDQKVQTADLADLVASVNQRLASLSLQARADGQVWDIQPQTIDVGSAATNRNSVSNLYQAGLYYTQIDYNNAANASGTIDTVQGYFNTAAVGNSFKAGTFALVSGTTFQCDDAEVCGQATAGSTQTFTSLTIAILIGEFIGGDARAAQDLVLDRASSGGAGVYLATGQFCDPTDSAVYSLFTGDILSLYGTGVEAGGSVTVTPTTASLALSTYAPTITATDNKVVTPSALALTVTFYSPTVTASGGFGIEELTDINQTYYEAYNGGTLDGRTDISDQNEAERAVTLTSFKAAFLGDTYYQHEHYHQPPFKPCQKTEV